jgi:hypothetical protein
LTPGVLIAAARGGGRLAERALNVLADTNAREFVCSDYVRLEVIRAIHVVAAAASNCQELVTSEKPGRPIHRTKLVAVSSIDVD